MEKMKNATEQSKARIFEITITFNLRLDVKQDFNLLISQNRMIVRSINSNTSNWVDDDDVR